MTETAEKRFPKADKAASDATGAVSSREQSPQGVLVVHKPQGWTSFDVVARFRRLTGQRKIGHTGTLDPMATGVLPLLLGNAARAESLLPETEKEYRASFRLGVETDTEDCTGTVLSRKERPVSREELEQALAAFRGEILQIPPMYSALKRNGKKLCDLARQGIVVEREPRPVTIYRLELLEYQPEQLQGVLQVRCSAGTYIRTLCADLGASLGTGGIMTELCRTQACGFSLEQAVTPEQAEELAARGELGSRILPVETLFSALPQIRVSPAQSLRFQNGGALDLMRTALKGSDLPEGSRIRVYGPEGFLGLGLLLKEEGILRVLKGFFFGNNRNSADSGSNGSHGDNGNTGSPSGKHREGPDGEPPVSGLHPEETP